VEYVSCEVELGFSVQCKSFQRSLSNLWHLRLMAWSFSRNHLRGTVYDSVYISTNSSINIATKAS
jgi:hypothetical protein